MLVSDTQAISALIPIRNGAKYLPMFLSNLEDCTDTRDELIFINDNSVDETHQILAAWAAENPNSRILQATGRGLASALNQGIAAASHEWIARFDCDDRYDIDRIRIQVNAIENGVVCVFSDYSIKGKDELDLGRIPSPAFPLATKLSLLTNWRTPHPVALVKKSAVLQVGGYLDHDFPAEDLSLWLRLSKIGSLVSVPKTLLYYRVHAESVTGGKFSESKAKARNLSSQGVVTYEELDGAIRNFRRTATDYQEMSLAEQRIFLHFVDILMNMRNRNYSLYAQISFSIVSFRPHFLKSCVSLLKSRMLRRHYRARAKANHYPV